MLKVKYIYKAEDIPVNWSQSSVQLWVADDARPPGAETVREAFERLTRGNSGNLIHSIDRGDSYVSFFSKGWVRIDDYDGGSIGVLIEDRRK